MKRIFVFSLFVCFPLLTQSADLPNAVIDVNNSNMQLCIQRVANDCISTVCLNSPELDCQDKCQNQAKNKCAQMQQE